MLSYANYYNLGMANLGFQSIYKELLKEREVLLDRSFLPYPREERYLKEKKLPLFSYITYMPLREFDIIAFSISFELDYLNFIKILNLAGIPIYSKDRGDSWPLIMVGGIAVSANPAILEPFVDFFVIGEGEEVIHNIVSLLLEEKNKDTILKTLSEWEGIYVPKYPKRVKRVWIKDVDKFVSDSVIYSKEQEFPDMHLIEIGRGCGRGCRFCMAGYIYRPVRNRSLYVIKESIKKGKDFRKKIGLVSPSVSDHPEIIEILKNILDEGLGVGISSLRSNSVTEELLSLLKKGGLNTITLAPEVGTEKMRKIINKNIYPELLFEKIEMALSVGIKNIKLYFLVGLPKEEEEDIEGILTLIDSIMLRFKNIKELILSINPFIPKPHTPFETYPQTKEPLVKRRLLYIEDFLKKNYNKVKLLPREIKYYTLQGLLSRGGKEISFLLPKIVEVGPRKFRRVVDKKVIESVLFSWNSNRKLPWEVVDTGIKREYLKMERMLSEKGKLTPSCPLKGCKLCGICS
ncbi:MAG TPA: radical SAM protein [Candidatus Atribacteria bacterium]|nr:radical SAM protein [Candidatus Atribacteria bacterium]